MAAEFAGVKNPISIESEGARPIQARGKSCFRSGGCESEYRAAAHIGHIKIIGAIHGKAGRKKQSRSDGALRSIGGKLSNGATAHRVISREAHVKIAVRIESEPINVSARLKDRAGPGRIEFVDGEGIQTAII